MQFLKNKIIYKKILLLIFSLISMICFFNFQNNHLGITALTFENEKIPKEFNNFKILHISDLHNKEFGSSQEKLIDKTLEISPDVIFITGDLIDSRRTSEDELILALNYIKKALTIAPVYYVSGNHEFRSGFYDEIKEELTRLGVQVLDDSGVTLKKEHAIITLTGLSDISFSTDYGNSYLNRSISRKIYEAKSLSEDNFSILLSHRPELISAYADSNIDLVFSGHAHGGQIRLPIVGGIIAPDQGFFPKYTKGIYEKGVTSMVVSRGLGNSLFPLRIFNTPELVVVTLKST